jgi:hypothetical protein
MLQKMLKTSAEVITQKPAKVTNAKKHANVKALKNLLR